MQDPRFPSEINRLGRILGRWQTHISNWHEAHVTNVPTEDVNNLMKRVKRDAFGFRNFTNYRIRALLHTGKPSWELLDSLALA